MSMNVGTKDIDPLKLMDLTITFSNSKSDSCTKKMKFLLPKDDPHLLETILKVDTGKLFDCSRLDTSFLYKFSQKFDEMKERHKTIIYKAKFQSKEMKKKNYFIKYKKGSKLHYIIKKKCKYQVHPAQVQEGIRKICYKLLPPEIIGDQKNNVKIGKAWKNLVKSAQTEPFNLFNLIKTLDLKSMTWLQSIENESHKSILIGKFIKWFFQFLITIVERIFHVTHLQGEIVFIFIDDWEKQKKDYLQLMCQKPVLQLIGPVTKYTEIKCRLNFIPKKDNLRPITVYRFTDDENESLKLLNTVLKHLYQKENQLLNKNFTDILRDYKSRNNKIFIVSCDIADAYGSILQRKLFEIIQRMFETLPTKIKLKMEMIRKKKQYQVITEDTNPMSYDPRKCETANKHVLLQALKNHIFQTKIVYKKNLYNINRGITQGLMISSILCQIYYTNMNSKYFSDLEKDGYLFKYIDDYLYVTDKLDSAQRFLDVVERGISEYNCFFKNSKLEHNLNPNCYQKIKYLGWRLDSESLEVEPIYNATRYSVYFNGLTTRTFPFKLKNLASLKLSKLILAKHINSRQKILENVALASRRQAERCFALLSCLYNTQQQRITIDPIIKANSYMLRKIQLFTNWTSYEMNRNKRKIKFIVWKSFYKVFQRKNDIFLHLIKEFKKLIKEFKRKKRSISLAKRNL